MSLSNIDEYYKKKAFKYFTKYNELKSGMNNLILKGGAKPDWYDDLVKEAKIIYDKLSEYCGEDSSDPKNPIILSGSAAVALLLANENMDQELHDAFVIYVDPDDFTSPDEPVDLANPIKISKSRPDDLDFVYQGTTLNDNYNIKSITIDYDTIPITYKRKQDQAISSPKYEIVGANNELSTKPIIKHFDLTNVSPNDKFKVKSFNKLPYVIVSGIKVLAPGKLLEFYEDNLLPKNTNKVEQLSNFVSKIESNQELIEKYRPVNIIKRYTLEEEKSRIRGSESTLSKTEVRSESKSEFKPRSMLFPNSPETMTEFKPRKDLFATSPESNTEFKSRTDLFANSPESNTGFRPRTDLFANSPETMTEFKPRSMLFSNSPESKSEFKPRSMLFSNSTESKSEFKPRSMLFSNSTESKSEFKPRSMLFSNSPESKSEFKPRSMLFSNSTESKSEFKPRSMLFSNSPESNTEFRPRKDLFANSPESNTGFRPRKDLFANSPEFESQFRPLSKKLPLPLLDYEDVNMSGNESDIEQSRTSSNIYDEPAKKKLPLPLLN